MKLLRTMLRISFATLLLALAVNVNAEDKKTTLKYVHLEDFHNNNELLEFLFAVFNGNITTYAILKYEIH